MSGHRYVVTFVYLLIAWEAFLTTLTLSAIRFQSSTLSNSQSSHHPMTTRPGCRHYSDRHR